MHKHVCFLVLTFFVSLFLVFDVSAQGSSNNIGLSVSPAIVDIPANPGSSVKRTINVINTSNRALPVLVNVSSLIPIDEEIDQSRRPEFDASTWLKVSQPSQALEPGEATPIEVTVTIPPNASPGGHYAQVVMEVLSLEGFGSGNTKIIPEVASAFFITVAGDIIEEAELETDNLISSYVQKGSQTPIKFRVVNKGNVHILPAPKVTILKNGSPVDSTNLQPQLILPNTYKEFDYTWPASVGYGEYEVQVEMVYGSQSIPLASEQITFRVGPAIWQIILGMLVLLGLILLVITRKNVPAALSALRGRSALVTKRFKTASDVQNIDQIDRTKSIDEFMGSSSTEANSIQTVKESKTAPPIDKKPEAQSSPKPTTSNQNTVKQAMSDKSVDEVEVAKNVRVSESTSDKDPTKKTLVVQTSATTIIRQTENSGEEKSTKTAVTTKKKPIKVPINVVDTTTAKPKSKKSSTAKKTKKSDVKPKKTKSSTNAKTKPKGKSTKTAPVKSRSKSSTKKKTTKPSSKNSKKSKN